MKDILLVILVLIGNLSILHGQEICNDGIDNDNNGLVDCADPACTAELSCSDKFECTTNAIFYQILDGVHFTIYNPTSVSFDTLYTNTFAVDAIGYNTQDGYIYGIKPNTNELIRIDRNSFFNLGTISGLPWPGTDSYVFGDIDLQGNLYTGYPTGQNIYKIDLTSLTALAIPYVGNFNVSDMAFNFTDDLFYGINANYELISFDPVLATLSTSLVISGLSCIDLGSTYIDSTGMMYVFCDDSGDLFSIDIDLATAELLQPTGLSLANTDGASCSLSDAIVINPPVLVCDDGINIALEQNCQVEVTYDILIEGPYYPVSCLEVVLFDANYNELPSSPYIDASHMGQTIIFEVRDICDGNSCSGTMVGEDKFSPIIDCPSPITISCTELNNGVPFPLYSDNCSGVTIAEVSNDYQKTNCDPDLAGIRTITYIATDASNNVSETCITQVFYAKPSFTDLVFPLNYDDTAFPDLPSLACRENQGSPTWDINANNYPDPSETGYLTDPNGNIIFPNDLSCDFRVSFSDNIIDVCESSFRVLRNWELLDWCNGTVTNQIQIINVNDVEGPQISCPASITLSADDYNCIGNLLVPQPTVNFDCGNLMSYSLTWSHGSSVTPCPAIHNGLYTNSNIIGNSTSGYTITGLPIGCSYIKYKVTDDCNNFSECIMRVEVEDNSPPIPVCKENTVVTLGSDGWAHVFAQSFDNGSHDNCSNVSFGVRRLAPACLDPSIPQPSVVFTDNTGVDYYQYVQFCCMDRSVNDLEVELVIWDTALNANTCIVNISVQDVEQPSIICAATRIMDCTDQIVFDVPVFIDNCGIASIDSVDTQNIDPSCSTGSYIRTWTVTDDSGMTASCSQEIIVQNQTPFSGPINWPADVLNLEGCINTDVGVSTLGEPAYAGDLCSELSHTHIDQVFNFVDGACFKILRNWTVIDWCQFDSNNPNGPGKWEHIQVIKVNDNTLPVLECDAAQLSIIEDCSIMAGVSINALDDCGDLSISYEIDFNADGSYDTPSIEALVANALWEEGAHIILWTVSDHCGNISTCLQNVVAVDTKLPSPYCIGQVVSVIMPTTGNLTLTAADYDLGSTDNCSTNLIFSFSNDVNHTSMTFDCSYQGLNSVQIWVTDDAGNQEYCEIELDLQDNAGVCPDITSISGRIETELFDGIKDVSVILEDESQNLIYSAFTDDQGAYDFGSLTEQQSYRLRPTKDDNYMNGVSTLDLLLIQKDILKLRTLDSPYKRIAADINGDTNVTAIDLILLRKLILGIIATLPSNDSWRFVDANQTFSDPSYPWPFVEELYYPTYTGTSKNGNFIGVKIGDVNENVTANLKGPLVSHREDKEVKLTMVIEDTIDALEMLTIYSQEDTYIQGLQLSFCVDQIDALDLIGASLELDQRHYFINDQGILNISWTSEELLEIRKGDALFSIASSDDNEIHKIELCQTGLAPQVYDQDLAIAKIVWSSEDDQIKDFELYQNVPNPFSNTTQLSYFLHEDQPVQLEIFSLNGKIILSEHIIAKSGLNTYDFVPSKETSGVYYYRLQTSEGSQVKKMLRL